MQITLGPIYFGFWNQPVKTHVIQLLLLFFFIIFLIFTVAKYAISKVTPITLIGVIRKTYVQKTEINIFTGLVPGFGSFESFSNEKKYLIISIEATFIDIFIW